MWKSVVGLMNASPFAQTLTPGKGFSCSVTVDHLIVRCCISLKYCTDLKNYKIVKGMHLQVFLGL